MKTYKEDMVYKCVLCTITEKEGYEVGEKEGKSTNQSWVAHKKSKEASFIALGRTTRWENL